VDDTEREDRLIQHIAKRDRIPIEQARTVIATLSVPDLVRLEMEAQPRGGSFESDYDPLGRE
jgi:hypothetical protein